MILIGSGAIATGAIVGVLGLFFAFFLYLRRKNRIDSVTHYAVPSYRRPNTGTIRYVDSPSPSRKRSPVAKR